MAATPLLAATAPKAAIHTMAATHPMAATHSKALPIKEPENTVGFFKLLKFATPNQKILMYLGGIASATSGFN